MIDLRRKVERRGERLDGLVQDALRDGDGVVPGERALAGHVASYTVAASEN